MTSHDVRDMLDLPGEATPRPTKKQKLSAPRPVLKGLAREVQNLSGDNPIAIVPEITIFKKRRWGSRKPATKWEFKQFRNSARSDQTLLLKHWRKKEDVPVVRVEETVSGDAEGKEEEKEKEPVIEDSTFAKYNVHVDVPTYTDEQYNTKLTSQDWTKDETDYLMNQVRDFDLRWPVIWDRYEYHPPAPEMEADSGKVAMVQIPKVRTMEDLKARYYQVAVVMMRLHNPPEHMNAAEFNLLELMQGYNPQQELARKAFAENAFKRTKEEAREEESLLLELKRILARSEQMSQERAELYARLEAPNSSNRENIYNTSIGLGQLIQQLLALDKSKKRKPIMGGGSEAMSPSVNGGPATLNHQPSNERRDSVRESVSGPSTNKKDKEKQGPAERRVLTPDEEVLYGVRYPDRITSGPAFRHEKILKPLTNKSNVQRTKIDNVLTELGVKPRLNMPTWDVGIAYDHLLESITLLLDQRKVADKIQGEIDLLKKVKEEKEKKERIDRGEPRLGDIPEVETETEVKKEEGEGTGSGGMETREKSASVRPGSGHKRSASVLSAVSDKSMKRQRK